MVKTNTLTARKGITFATALILVLAMFSSLFFVTLGKAAEEKDPNKYTVTFDANGGYFDEVDDKGNNKTTIARTGYKGQGLDDKSALVPHYPADSYGVEGKFFEGWTATNDTKINVDEATYDPEKDITVKAVWSDKIAVSFDDQQGNKDSVTTYYFDKNNAQIDIREIPQPKPVNGKVFAGWYTDKEGTSEALDYGVVTPNKTITYYAKYSDGVTIVLNANGGHYRIAKGTNEDGSFIYEYSVTKTIYRSKGDALRAEDPFVKYNGKEYGGYYTDNVEYSEKVEYDDIVTKDLTLYEKWVDKEELTDYYFLEYKVYNDEAKKWENYALYQIPVGESLSEDYYLEPADTATAKFQGWYTDAGLKNAAPAFDGTYAPENDVTLYAKYSDIISVDINYYYANNNGENVLIDTQAATYVKDDAKSDFSSDALHRLLTDEELSALYLNGKDGETIDPTKNGISTIWYADKAHTKVVNSRNDLTIDKDNKTSMYGVLVKRTPVTLYTPAAIGGDIVHMNDVISTPLPEDSKEKYITADAYINNDMKLGDAAKLYSVKNIPAKARMGFLGWTKTEDDKTPVSDETVKTTTKLYAIMNPAYVVTFDLNGGYDRAADNNYAARKNVVTVNIPNGQKLGDPIEEGYVYPVYYGDKYLKGWSKDRAGEKMIDPEELVITENTTLYAQWDRYTDEEPAPEPEPEDHYTGIRKQEYNGETAWWRVVDGEVDPTANEIYQNEHGWWKTTNGKVTFNETGVFRNAYGWWRVENSKVNFDAQGIYKNQYGWWKTTNGKVTFNETGIFKNDYGWWRVEDSKVNFQANGIYKNQYGWWKTTNGKVTFKETGIFKNEYGTWYCKDSKVDFNKNGKVTYNNHTYNVTNGKAALVK